MGYLEMCLASWGLLGDVDGTTGQHYPLSEGSRRGPSALPLVNPTRRVFQRTEHSSLCDSDMRRLVVILSVRGAAV